MAQTTKANPGGLGMAAIVPGMTVEVYRNLNIERMTGRVAWSIRVREGASTPFGGKTRVVGHFEPKPGSGAALALADCVPVVNEAGRQRVIRTRQREVHAWIVGRVLGNPLAAPIAAEADPKASLRYNPYRSGSFTAGDGATVIAAAAVVVFGTDPHPTGYRVRFSGAQAPQGSLL